MITVDPFSLEIQDEVTELAALRRALHLAEGYKLIFVRCNQALQRARLVSALEEKLAGLKIQKVTLEVPVAHLLDELSSRVDSPPPGAVFVFGLEYSLPVAAEAHTTPFIANLNAARDSFPDVVQAPLVLWVADYVLAAIARGAPDFFSIRSGVYSFAEEPDRTRELAWRLTADDTRAIASLPVAERRKRISEIQALLADYGDAPAERRDRRTESRLRYRLVELERGLGALAEAEESATHLLRVAEGTLDPAWVATALRTLGSVLHESSQPSRAEPVLRRALDTARQSGDRAVLAETLVELAAFLSTARGRHDEAGGLLTEALAIRQQQKGDPTAVAHVLEALGLLAIESGRLDVAEERFDAARRLLVDPGQQANLAQVLSNLANVSLRRGRLEEAVQRLHEALRIQESLHDRAGMAQTLYNLSLPLGAASRWSEAEELLRRSLAIARDLGDPLSEAEARYALAGVRVSQDRWLDAETLLRQVLAIHETNGRRARAADVLAVLAFVERQTGRTADAAEHARSSAQRYREIERPRDAARVFGELAQDLRALGRPADAESALREALALWQVAGAPAGRAKALHQLGMFLAEEQRLEEAEAPLREALILARDLVAPRLEAHVLFLLALVAESRDEWAAARERLIQSADTFRHLGDVGSEGRALLRLARVWGRLHDTAGALSTAREAAKRLHEAGLSLETTEAHEVIRKLESAR